MKEIHPQCSGTIDTGIWKKQQLMVAKVGIIQSQQNGGSSVLFGEKKV